MFALIHYGEIALKGKNRGLFERILIDNLKKTLQQGLFKSIKREFGRIVVLLEEKADLKLAEEKLGQVFGIVNFAFAVKVESQIEAMKEAGLSLLLEKEFSSFKVEAKRADKDLPFTSGEVNNVLGAFFVEKLKKKVNLSNPDLTLFIEITKNETFLFTKKHKGLGGLPVGVSGKAIGLLSGGIDSPVACFLAMKRGLEIIPLHFFVAKGSDKIEKLAQKLSNFQSPLKLCSVDLSQIQQEISITCKKELRVILLRRAMLKIAEIMAKKEKAKALLTGDNLGQVASQTIENLNSMEKAVLLPVLRPLLCYDKEEIINFSKKLGLFEISTLPYNDCCSGFTPSNPETKSSLREVEREEKKMKNYKLLLEKALENVKIKQIV